MKTILDLMFLPYIKQLGMKQTDTPFHNKLGSTYLCDQESANGFFWAYHVEDLFSVSVYDVDVAQSMSPRFNHPEFFAIGLFNQQVSEIIVGKRRTAPGVISYTMPEGTFSEHMDKGTHVSSTGITFTPKFLKELAGRFHISYQQLVEGCFNLREAPASPDVAMVIKQIFAARPASGCAAMYYEGKIMEVLSMLLGWYSEREVYAPGGEIAPYDLECLERVASYLQENYQETVGIEKLESIAYMGRNKLSFFFKQKYGMPIMEYLRDQKIRKAKEFLMDTTMTVDEIAANVGYQNQGSFSERFKLETGLTPTEYRKFKRSSPFAD